MRWVGGVYLIAMVGEGNVVFEQSTKSILPPQQLMTPHQPTHQSTRLDELNMMVIVADREGGYLTFLEDQNYGGN